MTGLSRQCTCGASACPPVVGFTNTDRRPALKRPFRLHSAHMILPVSALRCRQEGTSSQRAALMPSSSIRERRGVTCQAAGAVPLEAGEGEQVTSHGLSYHAQTEPRFLRACCAHSSGAASQPALFLCRWHTRLPLLPMHICVGASAVCGHDCPGSVCLRPRQTSVGVYFCDCCVLLLAAYLKDDFYLVK